MQIFSENDRDDEKEKLLICARKKKEIIEKRNELTVNRYLDEKKAPRHFSAC